MYRDRLFKSIALSVFLSAPLIAKASDLALGYTTWGIRDGHHTRSVSLSYESEPYTDYGIQGVGLLEYAHGGSYYASVGVMKTFAINDAWEWGGAFQTGFINHDQDLGDHLEFYSRVFTNYKVNDDFKVRVSLGHISNGGLSRHNPGSESFAVAALYHF